MVHYFSNKSITRSHQTLGDLYLNWEHREISDYKRSLDLSTAISQTNYKVEGYKVEQKGFCFSSSPINCYYSYLKSSKWIEWKY